MGDEEIDRQVDNENYVEAEYSDGVRATQPIESSSLLGDNDHEEGGSMQVC